MLEIDKAARILERVARQRAGAKARLLGAKVTVDVEPGHLFVIRMDMDQKNAREAARRLNDVAANVTPWPPTDVVEAKTTWDTTLHYLTMTEDLKFT